MPPYTELNKLLKLKKENEEILEKEAAAAKKLAEAGGVQPPGEEKDPNQIDSSSKKFDIL